MNKHSGSAHGVSRVVPIRPVADLDGSGNNEAHDYAAAVAAARPLTAAEVEARRAAEVAARVAAKVGYIPGDEHHNAHHPV